MHSPSVWGISPHIPPSSLFLFHCLSLFPWDAVTSVSRCCQWSGDGVTEHVRLANLPYDPKISGGAGGDFKSTDKCRGGSLFNLRVQTLPQDIASVFFYFFIFFFSFIVTKIRTRQKEPCFSPKAECGEERGHEERWEYHQDMTNDVIGQILPMGQVLFWLHQHWIIISFTPNQKTTDTWAIPPWQQQASSSFKIFFLRVVHPSCRQSISREISALDVSWTPTTPANILSKHALIKANEGSGRTSRKPTMKRS